MQLVISFYWPGVVGGDYFINLLFLPNIIIYNTLPMAQATMAQASTDFILPL